MPHAWLFRGRRCAAHLGALLRLLAGECKPQACSPRRPLMLALSHRRKGHGTLRLRMEGGRMTAAVHWVCTSRWQVAQTAPFPGPAPHRRGYLVPLLLYIVVRGSETRMQLGAEARRRRPRAMPQAPPHGGALASAQPPRLSSGRACNSSAPGFWIFPKGWGSETFILRFRPEFRPPTTHQILVLTHSRACACKLTHPPTHHLQLSTTAINYSCTY